MMKRFQARGCRIVEVPVHHYHRSHGSSQFFRFRHLRRVFVQLFVAWWKLVLRRERKLTSSMPRTEIEMRKLGAPR
jgi:hypothetical protein